MTEVRAKISERISRVSTIESFRLIVEDKVIFLPGQFLQVIFDEADRGNKELNKYLSFSSSPAKPYIEVTKKLSLSPFSQRLKDLKLGDEVLLKLPLGNCVFREEYKKICFLIGGIGITPVISIIEHIVDKRLDTDVTLLYSNRIEEIPFKKELDSWCNTNCNIKVIYIVTDCQPRDRSCISGAIDENLIRANVNNDPERIFFIFGPPAMVSAMKKACMEVGFKQELIKAESFLGY